MPIDRDAPQRDDTTASLNGLRIRFVAVTATRAHFRFIDRAA
jgi:hypothetical protein